jgi:site-specific DNA-methyltransferase (cytosine-N4-specific)
MQQLSLLDDLAPELAQLVRGYAEAPSARLRNTEIYLAAARVEGQPLERFMAKKPIGRAGQPHSVKARRLRWYQQDLKRLGWLEPVAGHRGQWQLTERAKAKLTPQTPGHVLVAYSTDLGVALWGACDDVFARFDQPITLCLTSPPFPLAKPRNYGNVLLNCYVDWLCKQLEPIAKRLVRGGSLALNVSNDIFEPGTPARSLYREHLVIALCTRLGLYKLDELVWENPTKAPGPVQWASLRRMQLNVGYEPVYVFTNDPLASLADNRRVLQQHTERHLKLIRQGGEGRYSPRSDGAYTLRAHSFGQETAGRIPRNVLRYVQAGGDPDLKRARAAARQAQLPVHGAGMPLALADFLVRYLCPEGGLVAEPFWGWGTTGFAAEINGRPWVGSELMGEYLVGSAARFAGRPGFKQSLH